MPEITIRDRFGYWMIVNDTPEEIRQFTDHRALAFMPTPEEISIHNCDVAWQVTGNTRCTCGLHAS